MATVTNRDIADLRDFLIAHMNTQFQGTHHRLDLINGRVGKLEQRVERNDVRISQVEQGHKDEPADENRRITQRDVNIVLASISACAAFGFVVWEVLPRLTVALAAVQR
jgi:hypothetical protein